MPLPRACRREQMLGSPEGSTAPSTSQIAEYLAVMSVRLKPGWSNVTTWPSLLSSSLSSTPVLRERGQLLKITRKGLRGIACSGAGVSTVRAGAAARFRRDEPSLGSDQSPVARPQSCHSCGQLEPTPSNSPLPRSFLTRARRYRSA
eukprot:scaffold34330_cov35-Tisochrysis_lutea.AAC.2